MPVGFPLLPGTGATLHGLEYCTLRLVPAAAGWLGTEMTRQPLVCLQILYKTNRHKDASLWLITMIQRGKLKSKSHGHGQGHGLLVCPRAKGLWGSKDKILGGQGS